MGGLRRGVSFWEKEVEMGRIGVGGGGGVPAMFEEVRGKMEA